MRTETTARAAWLALLVLFLVSVLNFFDRMILAAVLPLIQADLHFSDGQAGLLTGFGFAVIYVMFGLPLGRYADRANRKNMIAGVVAIFSVGTALCGFAQNFLQFFLARSAVAMGESGCMPASQSLVCDYFPVERRSSALGIQMSGTLVGAMLGLALGGYIGSHYGWRMAFWTLGPPGLLLALVVLMVREPVRGVFEAAGAAGPTPPLRQTVRALLANRTYVLMVLTTTAMAFCHNGVLQWTPSLFARYHTLAAGKVGLIFGVVYGLSSLAGILLGAWGGDRFMRKGPKTALGIAGLAYLLAFLPGLGFVLAAALNMSLALGLLFFLLSSVPAAVVSATTQNVTPPSLRGTVTAINMFVMVLLGSGGGPLVVGLVSDLIAPFVGKESLRLAMLVSFAGLLSAAALVLLAGRRAVADMARARRPSGEEAAARTPAAASLRPGAEPG